MSDAIMCDTCNKVSKKNSKDYRTIEITVLNIAQPTITIDMCNKCVDELNKLLGIKKHKVPKPKKEKKIDSNNNKQNFAIRRANRAKELRKENKSLKWTEALSQASKELAGTKTDKQYKCVDCELNPTKEDGQICDECIDRIYKQKGSAKTWK